MLTESEIISLIGKLKSSKKNLLVGDDIAAFKAGAKTYAASDSLIEGTHYRAPWLTPAQIAYKLFARNWSDFLCKGIKPDNALLNLNLAKQSANPSFIQPFLKELDHLLTVHGITLIGGDTAESGVDVFTLTFLGSKGKFIPRKNPKIRAGDLVLQLGHVGGSSFALGRLLNGKSLPRSVRLYFSKPQIFLKLPKPNALKATIDQSDSVDKSFGILALQNRISIIVDLEKIKKSHRLIETESIPLAAEDLAVFAIGRTNPSPAFRVIGHVDSIHKTNPGVVYRLRGKTVDAIKNGFEHFHGSDSRL